MRRLLHVIRNSDGTGRAVCVALLVAWGTYEFLTWVAQAMLRGPI